MTIALTSAIVMVVIGIIFTIIVIIHKISYDLWNITIFVPDEDFSVMVLILTFLAAITLITALLS